MKLLPWEWCRFVENASWYPLIYGFEDEGLFNYFGEADGAALVINPLVTKPWVNKASHSGFHGINTLHMAPPYMI